ncbi:hypothetical protein CEXT_649431 [Caerostris extrusa]|uniref:Uncharacterized protein n=1 Tax=Caerostris extrusa TaxID=172846 RepID=A0AAV4RLF7_CAEEX|nr:hypothetical protein CEXT_649431 [Caerostris extrusa]
MFVEVQIAFSKIQNPNALNLQINLDIEHLGCTCCPSCHLNPKRMHPLIGNHSFYKMHIKSNQQFVLTLVSVCINPQGCKNIPGFVERGKKTPCYVTNIWLFSPKPVHLVVK